MRKKRRELVAVWRPDGNLPEELRGFKSVKKFLGRKGKKEVTFIALGTAHANVCKL